ncbi:hypothetical protein FBU59_004439 [Linderina macrospora]|uniref:Uncharacterized protein n=1 Tax=Linderina macrospora TaxID=4868 RepID=A0ACC1J5E5_9FUNG|nr:hypothetical protein FBU59_004439 [Linderina macrospora]
MQRLLEEIEQHKQVQVQIGEGIVVQDTEDGLKEISHTMQRLAQDLHVVKMTLKGDRERVDAAKTHVTSDVKLAEKAANLVAHATDNGSWSQGGLTPMQMASRQRAMLAMRGKPGEVPSVLSLLQQGLDKDGASAMATAAAIAAGKPGDAMATSPEEAVRRIRISGVHSKIPSEFYWAWLTRVMSAAEVLADRLDQLEHHMAVSLGAADAQAGMQQQQQMQMQQRPTPKAVSDVIQYQNDSLIAIASKLATVDEEVRRLKRTLGIKESA